MSRRVLPAMLLLLSISALTFGCGDQIRDPVITDSSEGSGSESTGAFELQSMDWQTEEFGIRYIGGTIRNNTDKTYSYVQVQINLYDNSGAQVGSTLANINNLEPHATWRFKAIVLEDSAKTAKVKAITGF